MAYTPVRLYQGQPGTGTTLLYTATGVVIVKQIILANTDTAAKTVTIATGVAGAALAAANTIVPTVSVPPNTVITLDLTLVLANTDVIRGLQETATSITVSIYGVTA
jgi:hypothetical protein